MFITLGEMNRVGIFIYDKKENNLYIQYMER